MSQPIVDGLLYSNQEHVIFGPQGGSKTALVLDLALHCIYELEWMGRRTRTGKVVYVCGEGGGKVLANRIDAWLEYHSEELPKYRAEEKGAADKLLRVTEFPVYMLDTDSVDEFLGMLKPEDDIELVIVDTLSANFGAGDENAVKDMGQFLGAIRRVRLETRACVVVVHHTGHHDQTRPQGSNKLRRDFDTELLVNRDAEDENLFGVQGGGTLKNRNGAGCGMIPYRLTQVTLNERDAFGNPLTSVVVTPTKDVPCFDTSKQRRGRQGKNQAATLKALRRWSGGDAIDVDSKVHVPSTKWTEIYKSAGLDRKQAYRVQHSFVEAGIFSESEEDGYLWHPGAS